MPPTEHELMDLETALATGFSVGRYRELRGHLEGTGGGAAAWVEVVDGFRRRLDERFLRPIATLASSTGTEGIVPGFAILALDCLLIDTLQSFREGRIATGESSPAKSFGTFLKGPRFACFSPKDRDAFYHYVRNGLLHNGETRGDWKVRADTPDMLTRAAGTKTRILNRELFHQAIAEEVSDYTLELEAGTPELRARFLQRMDAICGLAPPKPNLLYFAYGSNLAEGEMLTKAPNARAEGIAFLPGYRLAFTKHSVLRRCDAASIEPAAYSMVWGFLYSVPLEDAEELARREGGYAKRKMTACRVIGGRLDKAVDVFTFVGKAVCPVGCGPAAAYVRLIVEGARARGLPEEYVATIAQIGSARSRTRTAND